MSDVRQRRSNEMNVLKYLLSGLLILFSLVGSVKAKPMPPATLVEGLRNSVVLRCRYLGLSGNAKESSYFSGVRVRYRVEAVIKDKRQKPAQNVTVGKSVEVIYQFDDGTACLAPPGWKFDPAVMPALDSSWILILREASDKAGKPVFDTYRGSWGRFRYSEERLREIEASGK